MRKIVDVVVQKRARSYVTSHVSAMAAAKKYEEEARLRDPAYLDALKHDLEEKKARAVLDAALEQAQELRKEAREMEQDFRDCTVLDASELVEVESICSALKSAYHLKPVGLEAVQKYCAEMEILLDAVVDQYSRFYFTNFARTILSLGEGAWAYLGYDRLYPEQLEQFIQGLLEKLSSKSVPTEIIQKVRENFSTSLRP